MSNINTTAIEELLSNISIANRAKKKEVVIPIKDANTLHHTLALVMTRLNGAASVQPETPVVVNLSGGRFGT